MTKRLQVTATAALVAGTLAWFSATSLASMGSHAPSSPVIERIMPGTPAPDPSTRRLTFVGRDFEPALQLEVVSPTGQTSVLGDDDILDLEPTTFAVMIILAETGDYGFTVRNADGGVSNPFVLTVAAEEPQTSAPVITGTTPAEPQALPRAQDIRVAGRHFETGLRAIVTDDAGQQLSGVEASSVTPEGFLLTVRLEERGTYSLVVSNPSGDVSAAWYLTVR